MKRFWAIFCSVALLAVVMLAAFPALSAEAAETFTDDMTDLTKENQTVGEWDVFPNHAELGLSVAGRKTTDAENSLIYSFAGKTIEAVSIRVAEYTGFLAENDLTSAVKVGDSWVDLALTQSAESDITGKESSSFKWVTFTADAVPENATELKVTLNNGVAWTLLIDEISVGLAEAGGSGDEDAAFVDTMDGTATNVEKTETWKFGVQDGLTVAYGSNTNNVRKLDYTFEKPIYSVSVRYLIHSAKYSNFPKYIGMNVKAAEDADWTKLSLTNSGLKTLEGSESYQTVTFTAITVPENMNQLQLTLSNTTGIHVMIDEVTVTFGSGDGDGEEEELDPSLAVFRDLKLGVLSDIHLADYETGSDSHLKVMLTKFKNEGMDAVLVTGDVANSGLPSQYQKFNDIWDSVFTDPTTAPQKLVIMGNHEFEQAYYKRETVAEAQQKYMDAYGYDTLNFHVKINGVHIIGINSEGAAVNGLYTSQTTDWLAEQLAAAKAEDPYQPIIVMCHQPLPNTTYGSSRGSDNTGAIYEALKGYSQVIYLAGHCHRPLESERSIMQRDFTCIDNTSLQYVKPESGTQSDSYSAQGGIQLILNAEAKTMTVNRLRIDSTAADGTRPAKDPWILQLPLQKSTFTYTAARKNDRTAPVFAEGAAASVSNITTSGADVIFPSASHSDFVEGYNITVYEKNGNGKAVLSKYIDSDFYISLTNMKSNHKVSLTGLAANSDFVVKVTALECFRLESKPITAEFSTQPITTLSPAYNRADFFDVNFVGGYADNSPYRRAHTLYGSSNASALIHSDALNRQVLSANGWINYPTTQGTLKKIDKALSMEIAFMVPGTMPTVNQCLFGNPESGGIFFELNADGTLTAAIRIGDAYKTLTTAVLNADVWYHALLTYDGSSMVLYLDGVPTATAAVTGTVSYNADLNWMTIGANVTTSGNAVDKFIGQIALARIYTNALTASEVGNAYYFFQNENQYTAVYEKVCLLNSLDVSELPAEDQASVAALITEGKALLAKTNLTVGETTSYVAAVNTLMELLSASNPSLSWEILADDCSGFTVINNKTDSWQRENNATLGKQIFTKNNNIDSYLIYHLPGNLRRFEVDALIYAGFGDTQRDLAFFVSKDGESWKQVRFNNTTPVNDPAYAEGQAVSWLDTTCTPAVDIGGEYTWFKVLMRKFENGVSWSMALDDIRMYYTDKTDDIPEDDGSFVPENFTLTDPYDTLDVATSASDNLVLNTPHAETQLNVVGRKGTVGESSLTYKKIGYRIGNFALKVQYAPDWTTLDTDLLISVRKANTNEWTALALTISEPTAIPNSTTDVFKSAVVTTTDALPEDAVELKVEMANGVNWTMFLDELSIDFLVSDLTDDPEQEPDGPDKPDIAFNFSELFESMDAIPEKSGNWELFAPHPETGLNVIGKTNNIKGTLTYKAEDGKVIDNFALKLQIAPAFFNPDAELLFQVRRAGSEEWETVALTVGYLQNVNASFSTCWVQPEAALGDDVTEIRFGFYNSVAWTLMVNELHLNYAPAKNSGGSETPDGPEAGAQAATAAVLLTALSGAAVVLFRRKKS